MENVNKYVLGEHMRGWVTRRTGRPTSGTTRGRREHRVLVGLLAALVVVASHTSIAIAASRHMYTNGLEFDKGPGYTGLYLERDTLTNVVLDGCWPVYATDWTWTSIAAGNRDFYELATAYRCAGTIQLIGVQNNGNWIQIAQSTYGTSPGLHTYEISQTQSDGFWNFIIDSNTVPYRVYIDGTTALQLEVLLETYGDAAIVPAFNQHDLWYRRYWGNGWARWSGRDGLYNPDSTWFCAKWMTDQKFRHGLNTSC